MLDRIIDFLQEARERDFDYDWTDYLDMYRYKPGICVHFTNGVGRTPDGPPSQETIPKIGVNVSTRYNTPVALYAYPVEEFYDVLKSKNEQFATNYKYIYFIQKNFDVPHIKDLSKLGINEIDMYMEKLISIYGEDTIESVINKTYSNGESLKQIASGQDFFYFTHVLADVTNKNPQRKSSGRWTVILNKDLGLEWIGDTGGVIHHNEPKQVMFFTTRSYKVLKLVHNDRDKFKLLRFNKDNEWSGAVDPLHKIPEKKWFEVIERYPKIASRAEFTNSWYRYGDYARWNRFINDNGDAYSKIISKYPEMILPADNENRKKYIGKLKLNNSQDSWLIAKLDKKYTRFLVDKFEPVIEENVFPIFAVDVSLAVSLIKTKEQFNETVSICYSQFYSLFERHDADPSVRHAYENFLDVLPQLVRKFGTDIKIVDMYKKGDLYGSDKEYVKKFFTFFNVDK
jgi:dephospho-CoA kinase